MSRTKGATRLYLDYNVYNWILEHGAVAAIKRQFKRRHWQVAGGGDLLAEIRRFTGPAEERAEKVRTVMKLVSVPESLPWSYREAMDVLNALRRHRPDWIRSDPDRRISKVLLKGQTLEWELMREDPYWLPSGTAAYRDVTFRSVGRQQKEQKAARAELLKTGQRRTLRMDDPKINSELRAAASQLPDWEAAELLPIRVMSWEFPGLILPHELVNLHQHSEQVDVTIPTDDAELKFEAKSLLMEANRRYFLINDRAHANSIRHNADAYVAFVTVLGGSMCMRSSLISLEEVNSWPTRTLGNHEDPARFMSFTDFAQDHLGLNSAAAHELRQDLLSQRGHVITADDLQRIGHLAYARLRELRDTNWSLTRDLGELIDDLLKVIG